MTCHRYLDFDRERGSSKLPKVFAVSTAKSVADFSDVARLGEEFAAWDCRETSALGLSIGDLLGFQHDYRPASLKAKFSRLENTMLLARVSGTAAGCGGLSAMGENAAEIKTLYVSCAFRGLGIGRALLQHLVSECQARRFTELRLETMVFMQDAVQLYQSFGFEICPAYYNIPDDFLPHTIFMRRKI